MGNFEAIERASARERPLRLPVTIIGVIEMWRLWCFSNNASTTAGKPDHSPRGKTPAPTHRHATVGWAESRLSTWGTVEGGRRWEKVGEGGRRWEKVGAGRRRG